MLSHILQIKKINENIFNLVIKTSIAQKANPGQFIHIKISDNFIPFLRRPMSIHSVNKKNKTIEILFRVIGQGTLLLSQKSINQTIDILGPIGNGFPITKKKNIVLIAGGIGIAPLFYLANKLKKMKKEVLILFGAKNKNELLKIDELEKIGCKIKIATEDGSCGYKGKVTDLLFNLDFSFQIIYACGPIKMYEKIKDFIKDKNIPCYVSLEQKMACGQGFCWGCVWKTLTGYKRVCKEGPVFDIKNVIL
ncbi:MAG: dihydroorotate dehydrogenase electron transfer subunit [bacterium]